MTKAEIIAIGDEILIGQITNTNAKWIATEVNFIGVKPVQFTAIADDEKAIVSSLDLALTRADVVFMTGGLGPTKDDITKHTLTKYFNTKLVLDERRLEELKAYFDSRGYVFRKANETQALLPENCFVVRNELGTASGMWFTTPEGKIVISMPGVPSEMKGMMIKVILPRLAEQVVKTPIIHRTIRTFGRGESDIAEQIEDIETALPSYIKLAYLPKVGSVRLRLSGSHLDENRLRTQIDKVVEKLYDRLSIDIFGEELDELESVLGDLLRERGETICTAESCTGGYIGHKLTSIPGSSAYFKGGVIAYSNEVKVNDLLVKESTLDKYGAVSEQVVIEMAENAKNKFGTDYSIACSGVAGPGGGTEDKPIGTIWLAICMPSKTLTKKLKLGNKRERNIHLTALHSINLLRQEIEKV